MTSKLLQSVRNHISERADLAAHDATERERAAFYALHSQLKTLAPSIAGQVEATVNRAVSLAVVAGWLDGWECGRDTRRHAGSYRAALAAIRAEHPDYAALPGWLNSGAPHLAEDVEVAVDILIGAVALATWRDGYDCAVNPAQLVFAQDGA